MTVDGAISGLRGYLRGLARRRNSGIVTADDAARWLSRNGFEDTRDRLRVVNSVLHANSPEFSVAGTTNSERPEMKGYRINQWSYVG